MAFTVSGRKLQALRDAKTRNTSVTWKELLLSDVIDGVDAWGGRVFPGVTIFDNGNAVGEEGRFTSEDPARDGANWYAYCGNNPLAFMDPTGLLDKRINDMTDFTEWQDRQHALAFLRAERKAMEWYERLTDLGDKFGTTGTLMDISSAAGYLAGQPEVGVLADAAATGADILSTLSYTAAYIAAPDDELRSMALFNTSIAAIGVGVDLIPVASVGIKNAVRDSKGAFHVGGQYATAATFGAAMAVVDLPKLSLGIGLEISGLFLPPGQNTILTPTLSLPPILPLTPNVNLPPAQILQSTPIWDLMTPALPLNGDGS
jgi:hypothetical protein